jgi:hypothetical protein
VPTPNELRVQAKECLELASRTSQYHAKVALTELAHKFQRDARQVERRERDLATYFGVEARRH